MNKSQRSNTCPHHLGHQHPFIIGVTCCDSFYSHPQGVLFSKRRQMPRFTLINQWQLATLYDIKICVLVQIDWFCCVGFCSLDLFELEIISIKKLPLIFNVKTHYREGHGIV